MQRLEDTLRTELVVREGRGTRFTPAGERLLAYARLILEAHDDAVADLGEQAGELIACAMDHAADLLLTELVAQLRERFPGRRIQIQLGRSARLRASVADSRLDIALVLERLGHHPDEPHALATRWVGAQSWELPPGPVPLVLFDHHCGLRTGALHTLSSARREHTVTGEAPDLAGIHAAVRAGLGVTLLPALGRLPDRLRVIEELPRPPAVIVTVQTAPHLDPEVGRIATEIIEELLRVHLPA